MWLAESRASSSSSGDSDSNRFSFARRFNACPQQRNDRVAKYIHMKQRQQMATNDSNSATQRLNQWEEEKPKQMFVVSLCRRSGRWLVATTVWKRTEIELARDFGRPPLIQWTPDRFIESARNIWFCVHDSKMICQVERRFYISHKCDRVNAYRHSTHATHAHGGKWIEWQKAFNSSELACPYWCMLENSSRCYKLP